MKHDIKTISQLRDHQDLLNDKQKIGLKYYDDILKRIPRSEIEQYERELHTIFTDMNIPSSTFEIVGSYRRGLPDSGV